jgi:Tripartite tricarboxylate transporter TctB family
MTDDPQSGPEAGISTRTMEFVVAALIMLFGALVVYDSLRLGAGWAEDGPQSGYFPFYIGLLLCVASLGTIAQVVFAQWKRRGQPVGSIEEQRQLFVGWGPLKLVFSVLVPSLLYVLGVQLIGIYVASAIYIAVFMVWLGHYSWLKSATISVAVTAVLFAMFEIWFKVPLFKGTYDPLSFLGY